jgi:adenine deaminase
MPGISMHTELELLVRLGLTPREALAAVTSNYSERFAWKEFGLVEAGRRADLLILTVDSTIEISNTRKIRSVILSGEVLDRDALLRTRPSTERRMISVQCRAVPRLAFRTAKASGIRSTFPVQLGQPGISFRILRCRKRKFQNDVIPSKWANLTT